MMEVGLRGGSQHERAIKEGLVHEFEVSGDQFRVVFVFSEDKVGERFAKIFFLFITLFHLAIICLVLR